MSKTKIVSAQRNDAASKKTRDSMKKVARDIRVAASRHVRNDSWKTRIDAQRRGDTWANTVTAFGVVGRDKRQAGNFLTDRVVDLEAEDIWRGDDMAGRAIETVPNQIVRAGFEVIIKAEEAPVAKEKKARLDWLRSPQGRAWWLDKVAKLECDGETKRKIEKKVREDLASDVFPESAVAENEGTGKEQSEATNAFLDDLGVLDRVGEVLKAERGYGGAALFPGIIDGVSDLTKPLDYDCIQSVDWLDVLTPLELIPYQWYDDPTEKNYGEPELFWMQRISVGNIGSTARVPIHESRLIRFPGIVVSRRQLREHWGWGDSVLVRMMEVLRDFQTSWQGASILLSDFAQAVMSIKGLADSFASGDATDSNLLVARATALDQGRSIARAVLIDAEEKFERQSTPISGMPEMLDRFCNRLAAAAHMPVTLLMGQAPAGLNATGASDVRAFYDNIAANRERQLKPRLTQLMKMIFAAKRGPTAGSEPDSWSWQWGPLWQATEKEEADRRYIVAQADALYITAQVLLPEEVAISRFGGDAYSAETHLDRTVREAFDKKAAEEAAAQAEQMQAQAEQAQKAAEGDVEAKLLHAKAAGAAGVPLKNGAPPAKPGGNPFAAKKDEAQPSAPAERPATLPWTSTGELPGGMGVPRNKMPQIVSQHAAEFLNGLGVKVEEGVRRVGELKPMQIAIRPEKVTELIEKFPPETLRKAIIVSRDGYILDGHHRWAALHQMGAEQEIQTKTVDLSAPDLLEAARRFPKAEWRDFDESQVERDENGKFAGSGGGSDGGSGGSRAEASVVGRKQIPSTDPSYQPVFYSFGASPGETKLASFKVGGENPDIAMVRTINNLGEVDAHREVVEKLGLNSLKALPGESVVYRMAGSSDGLGHKNAGNLQGVMKHASDSDERNVAYGHVLTAYSMKLPDTFEPYEYLRQKGKQDGHMDWDENQPRDERGRFGEGGGGGAKKEKSTKMRATSKHLPDNPSKYFHEPKGSQRVAVNLLKTTHEEPEKIERAAEKMAAAHNGEGPKRDPISLRAEAEGFTVLNGNSTTAVAKAQGWKEVVANVEPESTRSANTKPLPAGHTEAEHHAIAERVIAEHARALPAEEARFRDTVGQLGEVHARVKTATSAVNKLREKPAYGTADKLQDTTGMRVVAKDNADVRAAVEKIRANYEVISHDDYITNPKPGSGYRSYHMIVKTAAGPAEIQVRTPNQDRHAVWAHDFYKPRNETQRKLAKEPAVNALVGRVAEHFSELDNGRSSTAPSIPKNVKEVFGTPYR